jgi:DNA-binding response OmpR family regulator
VRILVVEDDEHLGPLLVQGLRQHHHAVDLADTVRAATDAATTTVYDVVCLDLGLPDGDGLQLCAQLKAGRDVRVPRRILALTARDAVADRIAGLDAGADDYLVKPFAFDELTARLRALDRRADEPGATVDIGDLHVDLARHVACRGGRELALTGREFAVLAHLVRRRGGVASAEDLLEHCWDANADPFTSSVRVILSRVRRKLGDPPLIETLPGVGYRLREQP